MKMFIKKSRTFGNDIISYLLEMKQLDWKDFTIFKINLSQVLVG